MRQKEVLSEICEIIIGRTPSRSIGDYWGKGHKWVSISDMKQEIIYETKEEITEEAIKAIRCRKIPKGTLLLSFKLSVGKLAFAGTELYTNEAIAALVIKDYSILNSKFLFYALKAIKFVGGNQAVMGITLNSKSLGALKIPLPPLDDQIRIAAVLTRAEKLIAKRKESIKALDELLKSTFLEMFGDPVRNEKGWEKKALLQLGSVNRGVSKHRPRNAPELLGGKYPLIQTGEISNSGTYITKFSQTYSEIGFKQSKLWAKGTLCITIAANIAKTGILAFNACFPDSVVGFIADKKEAHVLYVHYLFNFFQKILEKNAPKAAQKNINLEILRNLSVPKPPLFYQEQFAKIVEKVESIKAKHAQSLAELENLYGSLSQLAFKGELDLSRVKAEYEEGSEANMTETAVDGCQETKAFSATELNNIIKSLAGKPFSFDTLMAELERAEFAEAPDYELVKKHVFSLLEGEKPLLTQSFDKKTKEMVLSVKR